MKKYKLNDLIELKKGKKPNRFCLSTNQNAMSYVDIQAFEKGFVEKFTDDEKCVKCENGDLLIVCDGSRSGLVGRAIPGYVGSTLAILGIDERLECDYLFYFLQSKYRTLNKSVKGTGTPHLNPTLLKSFEISVPTIEEQKRIVARIEELFSNLDSAVEILQKTKQQLEVYRQAVLREVFLPFSNKIPLKEIIECKLGKMLDKNKNKGIERQYIRNANVRWFGFDLNDLLLMRISDEEIERYSVIKGDLIICEGGEPGRCAIWNYEEPIFYQKALHRVRFVGKHNAKFYMYYFYYLAKCGQLKHYFTGSGIKHLTKDSLSKVTVPIAKKENQDNVVNEIEAKLSVCENIEKTVDEALQQAEAMRQSILKQAFEGDNFL